MLKSFQGFRGVALLAEVIIPATPERDAHPLQFVIIASNVAQLEAIYTKILPEAPAFDPAMCQKSVMIQASILPE